MRRHLAPESAVLPCLAAGLASRSALAVPAGHSIRMGASSRAWRIPHPFFQKGWSTQVGFSTQAAAQTADGIGGFAGLEGNPVADASASYGVDKLRQVTDTLGRAA